MQNIEIKTRLPDRAAVEGRLKELGSRKAWVRHQRDVFFAVPKGWLKLREAGAAGAELIAYERATDDSGPRESDYDRMPVNDPETCRQLLGRALGISGVVEKVRTLYLVDHTRVHLDAVEGLGDFLELETVVDGISREEAQAETDRVIDALGLDPQEFLSVPYRDLLAEASQDPT